MISRRTILAWLGLAPFAIAATKLSAVAQFDTLDTVTRTRKRWKTVLNQDGSSDFVKGDKRFLDGWIEDQRARIASGAESKQDWQGTPFLDILDIDEKNHKAEVAAIEDRSNPWRELKEFEAETGIEVPMEVVVHRNGTVFEQDLGGNPEENKRRWKAEGLKEKYGDIQDSYLGYHRNPNRRRCSLDSFVKGIERSPRAETPCFSQIIEEYTTPDGRFIAAAG